VDSEITDVTSRQDTARRPEQATRRTLSRVVADQLLDRIRAGELRPGDRLPTEHELASELVVSRSTVRKAMQALVAMELVDVRPSRGAIVLGVPSTSALDASTVVALLEGQQFHDLYRLRLSLEAEIAAKAALRARDADLGPAIAAQVRCRDARRDAPETFYLADLDFHRALAAAGGNPIYGNILDALADLLAASRRATGTIPAAVASAVDEHDAVLAAVRAHDPERARGLMRRHIESAIHFLGEAERAGQLVEPQETT
jgi:GntR family transcriptional regulator, transcriptional repressor for pyruvate dehydrogenase complex